MEAHLPSKQKCPGSNPGGVIMGWADRYIELLADGGTIRFRPKGNSMNPKIKSGQLCTVAPVISDINVGDIVLCRVSGRDYLHLVSAKRKDNEFQISNNKGFVNGWINRSKIFGILTGVED